MITLTPPKDTTAEVLAALDANALVINDGGLVIYVSPALDALLGGVADWVDQSWAHVWAMLGQSAPLVSRRPQRVQLRRSDGELVPAQVQGIPIRSGTLVVVKDLSGEQERERESIRIFREAQSQADDLFALYQITQFMATAQNLGQLSDTLLREVMRSTEAEAGGLFLKDLYGNALLPAAWLNLSEPPALADEAAAQAWVEQAVGVGNSLLTLPLSAEEQTVGIALLIGRDFDQHSRRFLQTVAHEMAIALRAMQRRDELTAQEQKLEAIVAATTDGIIQVDQRCRVVGVNPAAATLLEVSETAALGRTCADVLGCADSCAGACPFAAVLASHRPIEYQEREVQATTGLRHSVAASYAPLEVGGDDVLGAVAVLLDISRQKQIEQLKADFITTVSHELRTPLTLLRGYSDTLLHLNLTREQQQQCFAGIADTTAALGRLVEEVLDVTRIEEGQLALQIEELSVQELVETVLHIQPERRQRVEVHADARLRVSGDRVRLTQVLVNLIDNALKYSPGGQPVSLRVRGLDGGVEFVVQDEGIGIPSAEQESIFAKFQRASNARASQIPGSGLGLYICRAIVEAHGGSIWLTSAQQRGTTVGFLIPTPANGL
jgi:PAS domain S-box-containing protein